MALKAATKRLSVLLIAAAISATAASAQQREDDKKRGEGEGGDRPEFVEDQLTELREGIARHEQLANEGERKAVELLDEIRKLDQRMLTSARRADDLQTEEAALAEEYGLHLQKVEVLEAERKEKRDLLARRLASIYKRGRLGSTRALAQAASSSEPLRMARYLAAISQSDTRVLREYETAQRELREALDGVEAKRIGVEEKKTALDDESAEYERARRDKGALLSSIEKDIEASRLEHDRLAALESELQRVIAASIRMEPEPEPEPVVAVAPEPVVVAAVDPASVARNAPADESTGGEPKAPAVEPEAGEKPKRKSIVARLFGSRAKPEPFNKLRGSLSAPIRGKVLSRYGESQGGGPRQKGIVVKASDDRQVTAIGEGEVVFSGPFPGLGNTLIINHGNRYHSVYAHLGSLLHEVGEKVSRFEILGSLSPADPTLHFELRAEGKALDPEPWFEGGYASFQN